MSQLFGHLVVMSIFILCAWMLIKQPAGRQLSMNARCERDFIILLRKIMECKNPLQLTELEGEIEDYYNTFAGFCIHAKEYRDNLLNLITQAQYV